MDPNRTQALSADPNRTMMGSAPSINATQTIKPIQCPVCKTFNPAGMMFCVECGLIFDRALPEDAFGAPAIQLPKLVTQDGREFVLRPGVNTVGREAGEIALGDPQVSRRHAQIDSDGGRFQLQDLGSTNGTKLNGAPLAQGAIQELKVGDRILFGTLEVELQLPGAASKNVTQAFARNQTAAMTVPPALETPAGYLEGQGERRPLKVGLNTFGRKPDNDIAIADPYVSGKHGVIELTDDGVFLTDIGSTNGTVLNEAKLAANMRTRVMPDDVIRLGSLEFRLTRTDVPAL